MPEYRIVPATPELAQQLAATMRAEDTNEVKASGGYEPLEATLASMEISREAFAALADDKILCMFGVARPMLMSPFAIPWVLTSEELPHHARYFLRHSRRYARLWSSRYGVLVNFVDARYTKSLEWLAWLGCDIAPAEPFGPDNLPFHRFELRG